MPATHVQPASPLQQVDSEASLAGPALRAFFRIADLWGLSTAQQRILLGGPPQSTYFKWKKQQAGAVPRDALERISYLLGIYQALQILLPGPAVRRTQRAGLHARRQRQ